MVGDGGVAPAIDSSPESADRTGRPGQFILAGSAVPADDVTRHTGAGRMAGLRMRPMRLYESGHSTGDISLAALLAGEPARAASPGNDIRLLAERACRGGWPGFQELGTEDAIVAAASYVDEICRTDISRVEGGRRHDPARVASLMRSLATSRPRRQSRRSPERPAARTGLSRVRRWLNTCTRWSG